MACWSHGEVMEPVTVDKTEAVTKGLKEVAQMITARVENVNPPLKAVKE